MERYCRECGKLIYGRSDKLYCDDSCRNSYNNSREREYRIEIEAINQSLKRNFKILKELTNRGKRRVSKEILTSLGFDFRYFTSIRREKGGKIVMQCYNYSYVNGSNGSVYISIKNN